MGVYESILQGLNEALAYAKGEDIGATEKTVTKTNIIPDDSFGLSALDVAAWLIQNNNSDENADCMTNLKLQKLLYYAQGLAIKYTGKTLFREDLTALPLGPVVVNVYEKYKHFGRDPIIEDEEAPKFDGDVKTILEDVNEEYGQFSASKLVNMSHDESPWKTTQIGHPITLQKMQDYFAR